MFRVLVAVTAAASVVSMAIPAAATAAPAAGPAIFVSPSGSDSNPGTVDRPIRTVEHAQQLVRQLDTDMSTNVTVELANGTYQLTEPLQLDADDSGTNGYNVVWTAAPGARPVLSGGEQITGWRLADASKGIWSAPAPAGLQTRQLYVNGIRAQRAAGPLPVHADQDRHRLHREFGRDGELAQPERHRVRLHRRCTLLVAAHRR